MLHGIQFIWDPWESSITQKKFHWFKKNEPEMKTGKIKNCMIIYACMIPYKSTSWRMKQKLI